MGGTAYAATSLGPNTVGTVQLKDQAVTTPKIDTHAVSAGKIGPGAVTDGKLGDGAVITAKLADGAVTDTKIANGSVTSTKLADGSVSNFKLGLGVVTHSKVGINSIAGDNVAPESISLADLVGANKSGSISFTRAAGSCGTLSLAVSGAQIGQAVLYSFTGNVTVPTSIVFGGARVTATNTIDLKFCNVGASNVSVSGLGIRVVTFG